MHLRWTPFWQNEEPPTQQLRLQQVCSTAKQIMPLLSKPSCRSSCENRANKISYGNLLLGAIACQVSPERHSHDAFALAEKIPGGQLSDSDWSLPIDIMAPGLSAQNVPCELAFSSSMLVSVHVYKEDLRWHIKLLPGCLIMNRTAQSLLLIPSSNLLTEMPRSQMKVIILITQE